MWILLALRQNKTKVGLKLELTEYLLSQPLGQNKTKVGLKLV